MLQIVAFSLISVCAIICVFMLWPSRQLNPVFYFVIFSFFFSCATFLNLDLRLSVDIDHLVLILVYLGSVTFYVLFLYGWSRSRRIDREWGAREYSDIAQEKIPALVFLFVFSASVTVIYYTAVGYNLLYVSLTSHVTDFTSMRLASYAGEDYMGAGIINQFKNVILPALLFIYFYFLLSSPGYRFALLKILIFVTLLCFYLWAILGTGQRTFLFFNLVCFFIFMYGMGRVRVWVVLFGVVIFIILFSLYSFFLGRTEGVGIYSSFSELGWRLFFSNQVATIHAYRYVSEIPISYGLEWLEIISGYVPGVRGSDLSNRIHEYIFGSYRGTAPASLWVSIYHNFGLLGVPFSVFFIMKFFELSRLAILMVPKNTFWIMVFSFYCFYVGILPVSNPFQIVNNGLLGLGLMVIFYSLVLRRNGLFLSPNGR